MGKIINNQHDKTTKAFSITLFPSIREVIEQARSNIKQIANHTMVEAYWHIGRIITEHEQQGNWRAEYGKQQINKLSSLLSDEFGKGFDARNLRNMRKFYQSYPNWNAVRTTLSWTHYRTLMRIANPKAREWYEQESIEQQWSARVLERQIGVFYYERLLSSKEPEQVKQEAAQKAKLLIESPKAYLRDPYLLDFLNLPTASYLESDLEKGLINNLKGFLLELGKGFAFVAQQQRVQTDDQDFYIDLVFYNYKLKCFLLIDLKLGKLTHQDIGQMDSYVRIYDHLKKGEDDNPSIGLILCSQKSEAIVKYSVLNDSEQLFAAKYLPTEEELRLELERERELVQQQIEGVCKNVRHREN